MIEPYFPLKSVFFPGFEKWFRSEHIALGVHEPPRIDPERFLSMIRFDTRQKLDDIPDFQLDS